MVDNLLLASSCVHDSEQQNSKSGGICSMTAYLTQHTYMQVFHPDRLILIVKICDGGVLVTKIPLGSVEIIRS